VQVKNLHVPISEVVPELDGEPAENVYAQPPACGIVLDEIREVGTRRSHDTAGASLAVLADGASEENPKLQWQ